MLKISLSGKLGLLAMFLFLLCSCGKDDDIHKDDGNVCFEVPEGDLYAELEIRFDASCSDPVQYYIWDFGDGDVGTGMEVGHVYDAEGEYEVRLSTGNHQDSLITIGKVINVLPSPFIKHCDDIEGDETWEEGMHLVRCNITINGSLTIEPGAKIYIEEENLLEVVGTLTARGTATQPIQFRPANSSSDPGSWGYIHFTPTASSTSILDHCELMYGGKADQFDYPDWDYYTKFGMIHINECEVSITNTTITGAANFGISMTKNAKFVAFENNAFSDNTKNPIELYGGAVNTLSNTSSFAEGGMDILIRGEQYFNPGADIELTWYKQDVPYSIDYALGFNNNFTLIIEAGTTIKLASEGSFGSGYLEATKGNLIARGTADEPVVFTSAKAEKSKGDWAGILIGSNSVLEHCVIEYAGSDYTVSGYNRALTVYGTGTVVKNCIIQESSGLGMEVNATTPTITDNVIRNVSSYGIVADLQNYGYVDETNILESTGGFYLNVDVQGESETITKRSYPYIINSIYIYGGRTLNIEPGTEIQLRSKGSIAMGYDYVSNSSTGNIIANGTAGEPIVFNLYDKDKEADNGNWGTIFFGATSTSSLLNYCTFNDGGNRVDGNGNVYPNVGMINCYQTAGFPVISNCTFNHSATYAITLDQSTIDASGNTFNGNVSGDIQTF